MFQLSKSLCLNLPHPIPGNAQSLTDCFKGMFCGAAYAKSHPTEVPFAVGIEAENGISCYVLRMLYAV